MSVSPDSVYDSVVVAAIREARAAAHGLSQQVPPPFPSPADWRDHWIYFLMIDRFNHPTKPPASGSAWNQPYSRRQGGSFKGIEQRLDYLKELGVGAVWITPVVKNPAPEDWEYNYHGYAAQDLLAIDPRFGSDGTRKTAEAELRQFVDAAHDRGIYVILDIVLNHTGRVFDYWINGKLEATYQDAEALRSDPMSGRETEIAWMNGLGKPRPDWTGLPPDAGAIHPDDAVHPAMDFRKDFFRRRGEKTNDEPDWPDKGGFVVGDFGSMRQLVVEYFADRSHPLYERWGANPVLTLLVRAYSYLVARYDFDGFRIDTAKYVDPIMLQYFGNAIREFAMSLGKCNFFTFGEVWDDEETLAKFVGRNGNVKDGFGIDAAKDFPLFQIMKTIPKAFESGNVNLLYELFKRRKKLEEHYLTSHGEASRFFVTFLDNHDQRERFRHPDTPDEQVRLALALLYTLQGIPCLYYGTEQDLSGTVNSRGEHVTPRFEGVREALWGKTDAFSTETATYRYIQRISELRKRIPALRYGRQYFRPVSGNGTDFGLSTDVGGIVAFSRILVDVEVLVVANTSPSERFDGYVLIDTVINSVNSAMGMELSSLGTPPYQCVLEKNMAVSWKNGVRGDPFSATHIQVNLAPMEFQIFTQVL